MIKYLKDRNINNLYGDAGDVELLDEVVNNNIKMIISASKELSTNMLLIDKFTSINKSCIIVLTATSTEDAIKLYNRWATYIIIHKLVWWKHISDLLDKHWFDIKWFNEYKNNHLEKIEKIKIYKKKIY